MDITQFHAAFFEESREGLDAMESGLLGLEHAAGDMDAINVVFRAPRPATSPANGSGR